MTTTPESFFSTILDRKWWLILPTIFMTSMAVGYAILKPDYWDATQALFVRDEVASTGSKLGSFESTDAMQTAQETILEVALHHNTLRQALEQVGPPKSWLPRPRNWPSAMTVEDFRKSVSVTAPNGAKFGRTEMIYLTVTSRGKTRAVELTNAVVDQLIARLKKLRQDKYAGIMAELHKTIDVAESERDAALNRMKKIEKSLGGNLVDLRVLNNSAQGEGVTRRDLSGIKTDLRLAKTDFERKLNSRKQLVKAQSDPQLLIAMPNEVLDSQPTLRRLKEGLVDAQIAAARVTAELSPDHPRARAALGTVQKIKNQLFGELRIATRTLDGDIQGTEVKIANLLEQMKLAEESLAGLSNVRAEYDSLDAEVTERTTFLELARRDLSSAKSNQIAASNVSLIQRVDEAIPGSRPIGPSGKSIVLAGLIGGLFTGLGLIYIFQPNRTDFGRRHTDNNVGQRAGDQAAAATSDAGRRQADQESVPASFPYWPNGRRKADQTGKAQPAPQVTPAAEKPAAAEHPAARPIPQQPAATQPQQPNSPAQGAAHAPAGHAAINPRPVNPATLAQPASKPGAPIDTPPPIPNLPHDFA